MSFESLPNEFLLDLFDYLNSVDLFHAFYDLNYRFNNLLYKQHRTFHFNFNSISKRQFDVICQEHFPVITDRIITLTLSNGDLTPQQIDLFFSYIPSINQFTHLRALSLSYVYTYEIIMKIIDQCQQLRHFNHFKFNSCSFTVKKTHYQAIMNNIWSLSKLTHCELDIIVERQLRFCLPTKISLSLEHLSFTKCEATLSQVNQLYENTPNLKYLSIFIVYSSNNCEPSLLTKIINLKIYFHDCHTSNVCSFLQNIPNLYRLNIVLSMEIIDGNRWKEIITSYLPKLRIFQFKMCKYLDLNESIQKTVNRLINSFRSPFWNDEHRWYVRCFTYKKTVYLSTLNNTISCNQGILPDLFASTSPDDNLQNFCNDITNVYGSDILNNLVQSHVHFINIRHLTIQFPINNEFWSIVPSLNKLRTLEVSSIIDHYQSQFHDVLNRAPHLYKLTILQYDQISLQMTLFEHRDTSIRELDMLRCEPYFNKEQCAELCHSSIGSRCEVLYIQVDSRESILHLVSNMTNLRALKVRCKEHIYTSTETNNKNVSREDDIVQWLKERLPSTYLINKLSIYLPTIHLWI